MIFVKTYVSATDAETSVDTLLDENSMTVEENMMANATLPQHQIHFSPRFSGIGGNRYSSVEFGATVGFCSRTEDFEAEAEAAMAKAQKFIVKQFKRYANLLGEGAPDPLEKM